MNDLLIVVNPVSEEAPAESEAKRLESLASVSNRVKMEPKKLAEQMNLLIEMFDHVNAKTGGAYELSSVEVELVVTATGKLAILGSGIEGGATAGMRARISKKDSRANKSMESDK